MKSSEFDGFPVSNLAFNPILWIVCAALPRDQLWKGPGTRLRPVPWLPMGVHKTTFFSYRQPTGPLNRASLRVGCKISRPLRISQPNDRACYSQLHGMDHENLESRKPDPHETRLSLPMMRIFDLGYPEYFCASTAYPRGVLLAGGLWFAHLDQRN